MSWAIIMIYINITDFALISYLEKDHSMIETRCLKNVVIFIQTKSNKFSTFIDFLIHTYVYIPMCTYLSLLMGNLF